MSLEKLKETVDSMDPEEALTALAQAVRSLLPLFSPEVRLHFVANLLGESRDDKVASMVHL